MKDSMTIVFYILGCICGVVIILLMGKYGLTVI